MALDEETIARFMQWVGEHKRLYQETDGREGHIVDLTMIGGKGPTPTLLLKTVGRRSGQELIVPLIYGKYGDDYVIIASKGGSPDHPAWFLNMQASAPAVAFQAGTDHFIGTWREAEGEERQKVWDYMVDLYPPYTSYQASTDRRIPVVMMRPTAKTETL